MALHGRLSQTSISTDKLTGKTPLERSCRSSGTNACGPCRLHELVRGEQSQSAGEPRGVHEDRDSDGVEMVCVKIRSECDRRPTDL